uniref:Uncharacterized protein n=1 Tax=Plectus sambesii TaxID=2011161 RepID=A0A914URT7_9BILA
MTQVLARAAISNTYMRCAGRFYGDRSTTWMRASRHSRLGQERESSSAAAASNYHIMRAWTRGGGLDGTNDCDGAAKSPTTAPNPKQRRNELEGWFRRGAEDGPTEH